MAIEAGALNATLAAAAGDDPLLLAELRDAFLESLARQVDLLRRSRCDGKLAGSRSAATWAGDELSRRAFNPTRPRGVGMRTR